MKLLGNVSVALVDAADGIIRERGYEALKVRDLAASAGCSVGMVYKSFGDMDKLIYAVKVRVLDQLEAVVNKAVDRRKDAERTGVDELVTMSEVYLDFAIKEEQRWRALFQHRPEGERSPPAWYQQHLSKIMGRIDQPISRALPGLDAREVHQLSGILFSSVHGIVTLGVQERLGRTSRKDMRSKLAVLVRSFMAGYAATKAAAP